MKKHHDVAAVPPPGVHFDHRTDHEHAGPGGADPAGQHRAQEQEKHIDSGRTGQIPLQRDIAGHAEQAEQQHNKGEVVADQALQRRLHRRTQSPHQSIRDEKGQRPERHRQGLMALPPRGAQQRTQGDAQQQPRKGDAQPKRDLSPRSGQGGPIPNSHQEHPQHQERSQAK